MDQETNKLIKALIDVLGYEIQVENKYYDTDTWEELEPVNGIIKHPPSKIHVKSDYRLVKK